MDAIRPPAQPRSTLVPTAATASGGEGPSSPLPRDQAVLGSPMPPAAPSPRDLQAIAAPRSETAASTSAAVLEDPTGEGIQIRWGRTGHLVIHQEAATDLPPDMPAFFLDAKESLVSLSSQPDRWKFPSLKNLNSVNRPDHWINTELLHGREFPSDRYSYLGMIVAENLNLPKSQPASVGFLPYRLVEVFEELQAEMALWRHEVKKNGPDTVFARQLQDNVVYTAGLLGHYVGDAAQPLHVSAHGNGWDTRVEPNPEGFTTDPGIHARFESRFVDAAVAPGDIAPLLQPARVLGGDMPTLMQNFVADTHSHVRDLYRLERDGKLDPKAPSPEGRQFVRERVAAGAQFLRDLWYTAWVRSEALEKEARDPEMQWELGSRG